MRIRLLALSLVAGLGVLLVGAACTSSTKCSGCSDLNLQIPWTAPETHTYLLQINGKDVGRTTLSITEQGGNYVLTQNAQDDNGNSDDSTVVADKTTLKPLSNTHTVIDTSQKRMVNATYETGAKDCETNEVVRIEQLTFSPPAQPTPDTSRSSPLCVPPFAYDNDSSLFLWRAVKFEKGYTATYQTVLSNRRDTQIVSLEVHDIVNKTPLGDGQAWEVRLTADQLNQRAWFSTDPSHKMLAYQNDNYLFLLAD